MLSYYEFPWPRTDRLTDEAWRNWLGSPQPPIQPAWVANFSLMGGGPVKVLAFRVGDVYLITQAGENLNVRSSASRQGQVLGKLQPGDYIEILEGPVVADGYTWWRVRSFFGDPPLEGWAVEHQDWYQRAWGQ